MSATVSTGTMPAEFIGHGNPMNALEQTRFTEAWRDLPALPVTREAGWTCSCMDMRTARCP